MIKFLKYIQYALTGFLVLTVFSYPIYAAFLPQHIAMYNYKSHYVRDSEEYKEIMSVSKKSLQLHATKECGDSKNTNLVVSNIFQNYALIRVIPNGGACNTDPAYIVLNKVDAGWEFVTLGTAVRGDGAIPDALFSY